MDMMYKEELAVVTLGSKNTTHYTHLSTLQSFPSTASSDSTAVSFTLI